MEAYKCPSHTGRHLKILLMSIYGSYCVRRIVAQSMWYFLHLCDCSVLYCAYLEAWNWVVAGQHLNASQPRSSIWPNLFFSSFSGNYFWKNLNCHIASTIRAFDLIPKLRARPENQLSSGINKKNTIQCVSHRHYLDIDTNQSILNNPSGPQSNVINYKLMTWLKSLFCLQMSSHIKFANTIPYQKYFMKWLKHCTMG